MVAALENGWLLIRIGNVSERFGLGGFAWKLGYPVIVIATMNEDNCGQNTASPCRVETPMPSATAEQQSDRGKKTFRCDACGHLFESAAKRKSHQATNSCCAPYACRLCAHVFHRAGELVRHAESAHADPRMCVLCGRLLSRKDKLENHVRTHTGEQPYECEFCRKRFSRRDRLNEHEKMHRGVSFKCVQCQKCFSRRDKMRDHVHRSHRGRVEEEGQGGGSVR